MIWQHGWPHSLAVAALLWYKVHLHIGDECLNIVHTQDQNESLGALSLIYKEKLAIRIGGGLTLKRKNNVS